MNRVLYTMQNRHQVSADLDWLTEAERLRLDEFRFEKRRNDWLLGRWTAKLALLGVSGLSGRDIGRFEVQSAADGAPLPLLDGKPYEVGLSLSHSNDRAICAVSADIAALGCDVELVGERSAGFAETFFTDAECDWVESADPAKKDLLITLVWSAKESALKTLRHGLSVDTRSVEVSADSESATAEWNEARIQTSDDGELSCWWRVDGSLVLTVAAREHFDKPARLEPGAKMDMKRNPVLTSRGVLQP